MRFRTAHFACLVLLFSSLGVAEASALRSVTLAHCCMARLLQHGATQHQDETGTASTPCGIGADAPVVLMGEAAAVHAVASPAAQTAQVHTFTSLRR